MLTVALTDFEVDGRHRNLQQVQISILQNSALIGCQSLSKMPVSFSLPIQPVAYDFTVMLRDYTDIIGSLTIPSRLFQGVTSMSIYRWLTLFDPMDDLYDGDLREDDYEAPRIRLHFSIKQIQPRTESKIVAKDENLSFVSKDLDETANQYKELQALRHKVQVLTENKDRVSAYKEKYKALIQEFDQSKLEWQEERGQYAVTIQQLQSELSEMLKRTDDAEETLERMKEEYQQRFVQLQQESDISSDALKQSFSKREDEIQQYKQSLEELGQERTSLYQQIDSERQRWQSILNDYTQVKEKYRQSLTDIQSLQKVQQVMQAKYESELQQASNQMSQLSRQLVQMESQLNHSRLDNKNLKEENMSLKERLGQLESLRDKPIDNNYESPQKFNFQGDKMWEQTVNQLNQQLEMLNNQLNQERSSQISMRGQINQLSMQLNDSEIQRKNLQQEILRAQDQRPDEFVESVNKEQQQQMHLLNQEKEILLSKIKVLENQVQIKTEAHLEAQQDLQECKLKLQTTMQRLQVQEKLIEQIEQLRQDKLDQTEQLSLLQNNIYKLGEEILQESLDQEFSRNLIMKINRIIQNPKGDFREAPKAEAKVEPAPKIARQSVKEQPKEEPKPVRRAQSQRFSGQSGQSKKGVNSSRMSNVIEEVHEHGDSFSINSPAQAPQPAKQQPIPSVVNDQFKSNVKSVSSGVNHSSNSPSPSPERPRTRPQQSTGHTSVRTQIVKQQSPTKNTVSPQKSPPKSVRQPTQGPQSVKDSPPKSVEKRRQSTLFNQTKSSTVKTQKK